MYTINIQEWFRPPMRYKMDKIIITQSGQRVKVNKWRMYDAKYRETFQKTELFIWIEGEEKYQTLAWFTSEITDNVMRVLDRFFTEDRLILDLTFIK